MVPDSVAFLIVVSLMIVPLLWELWKELINERDS